MIMKRMSDEQIKQETIFLLDKLDEICKSNDISYFLGFGTLLGG